MRLSLSLLAVMFVSTAAAWSFNKPEEKPELPEPIERRSEAHCEPMDNGSCFWEEASERSLECCRGGGLGCAPCD